MLKQNVISHINLDELCQMKIPALKGRARTNNLLILETIAAEGPLLKYDVYRKLRKRGIREYSTVTRRIDSLRERKYLDEASKRITERGKREAESMYGLTWKGFIASLVSENVQGNILKVIGKNPLLAIPEKEFVLLVLEDIFDPKEVKAIAEILLYGYLMAIPNLESIEEDELWIWILQALKEIPPDIVKVTEIPDRKKDLTKLLDNPRILQYLKDKILPKISEYERNLYILFQFFKILNELGDFVSKLDPEDKPSEKLKEYLENMKLDEKIARLEAEIN